MREEKMGNAFVHAELATTDVDRARAFYGKLFDWKLEDIPVGEGTTYTTIGVGEGTGGGMMKQMVPGAPSAWMPYVGVADIRESTKKAKSLGATIVRDVTPVMELGWLSILKDTTGAVIGLWQPKM
jgi:predicted enzyme related to lactoylglutathione lyase